MIASPHRKLPIFWRFQCFGWVVFFLGALLFFSAFASSWGAAFGSAFYQTLIGGVLSFGLRFLYREVNDRGMSILLTGMIILLASSVAGMIAMGIDAAFLMVRGTPLSWHAAYGLMFQAVPVFLIWSLIYFWIACFLRLRKCEAHRRDTELQILRSEMRPHFVFNTLNSMLAEVDHNPQNVKVLGLALAEYLHFLLIQKSDFAVFGKEIDAIRNFLRICKIRYEEQLEFSLEMSEEVQTTLVPAALILPLVENAIKYGMRTSPSPLRLRVWAEKKAALLHVYVQNTGKWLESDAHESSTGIGLANLRRRLEILYGRGARLDIHTQEDGICVEVCLPARIAPPIGARDMDRFE